MLLGGLCVKWLLSWFPGFIYLEGHDGKWVGCGTCWDPEPSVYSPRVNLGGNVCQLEDKPANLRVTGGGGCGSTGRSGRACLHVRQQEVFSKL